MPTPTRKVKDIMIKHEGAELILPADPEKMKIKDAIEWLKKKDEEDNKKFALHEVIDCSPLDGLVALHKALSKKFGWVNYTSTPGFFGDTPPTFIGVAISPTETLQVPYGRIQLPNIEGYLQTNISPISMTLGGEIKYRNRTEINEIIDLTRVYLRDESIYKGSAIKVDFTNHGTDKYNFFKDCPQFMDLSHTTEDSLIFSEETLAAISLGLFTPIENAEACRRYKIPLKRGILLYGPYGTGKTMTAYVAALKAQRHGWTFVYLNTVRDLKKGLEFAAKYAPAVLFAEDIDRVMTGERSIAIDDILNTLDGVDTKSAEIITVLTTNHIENINPAILRMGRLDTLVHVTPPDANAASKLVEYYGRQLLEPTASTKKIGKALAGHIPAFIRETVERAKIAAIARLGNEPIKGRVLEEDVLNAAHSMKSHADLLKPRETNIPSDLMLTVQIPAGNKNVQALLDSCKGTTAEHIKAA